MISAIANVTADARPMLRRLTTGWSNSSTQTQAQTKTTNHGSERGPSQRLPRTIGTSNVVNGTTSG